MIEAEPKAHGEEKKEAHTEHQMRCGYESDVAAAAAAAASKQASMPESSVSDSFRLIFVGSDASARADVMKQLTGTVGSSITPCSKNASAMGVEMCTWAPFENDVNASSQMGMKLQMVNFSENVSD